MDAIFNQYERYLKLYI